MSSHVLTLTVTPEEFAERCFQVAQKVGHPVVGDTGTIEYHGAAVKYEYDGVSQLTLTVLKHPLILTEAATESIITNWFHPQA